MRITVIRAHHACLDGAQVAGTSGKVQQNADEDTEGISSEEHALAIAEVLGVQRRNEVCMPPFCHIWSGGMLQRAAPGTGVLIDETQLHLQGACGMCKSLQVDYPRSSDIDCTIYTVITADTIGYTACLSMLIACCSEPRARGSSRCDGVINIWLAGICTHLHGALRRGLLRQGCCSACVENHCQQYPSHSVRNSASAHGPAYCLPCQLRYSLLTVVHLHAPDISMSLTCNVCSFTRYPDIMQG